MNVKGFGTVYWSELCVDGGPIDEGVTSDADEGAKDTTDGGANVIDVYGTWPIRGPSMAAAPACDSDDADVGACELPDQAAVAAVLEFCDACEMSVTAALAGPLTLGLRAV